MSTRYWRDLIGVGVVLAVCLPAPGQGPAKAPAAGEWPVFRGNALQTGVAGSALPDRLQELWKFKSGDAIEGAPAVVGGVVYVGSFDEHLYALDLASGAVKWKYHAGPIKASPAVQGGLVFVGNADGVFHCVDAARGQKRWTFETEGPIASGAVL